MRRAIVVIFLLLFLTVGAAAALVVAAIESEPLVAGTGRLSPAQVERAVKVLNANDPRRLRDGQIGQAALTASQITLALTYLIERFASGGTRADIAAATASLQTTVALPGPAKGRYVNMTASLREGEPLPAVEALQVGRVPIPAFIADFAMARLMDAVHADADARAASEMIRSIRFTPNRVQVTYRWREDTVKRLRARLVPEADQERMRAYNDHLVRVARGLQTGTGLHTMLVPLLQLASERSAGGEAAAENRAALVVLEAHVNQRDLGILVPNARDWPKPRGLRPTLQGRRDFSQHFLTSAVVAALAGTGLADAIGIYKELDDSRGGSGFSFTDLAADRAGTRFGERAASSSNGARDIQAAAIAGLGDTDLLPPARDLPEHMDESEFRTRFGGLDDPRYLKVARDIERRLDALPLYR